MRFLDLLSKRHSCKATPGQGWKTTLWPRWQLPTSFRPDAAAVKMEDDGMGVKGLNSQEEVTHSQSLQSFTHPGAALRRMRRASLRQAGKLPEGQNSNL